VIIQNAIGQLAWGDYDNDGDLDYISVAADYSSMSDIIEVFKNNGNGSFAEQANITSNLNQATPSWADFDNDGDLDFLLSGWINGSYAELYKNNGNGTFSKKPGITIASLGNGASVWADFDNDGDLDFIITGHTDIGNTKLYKNNGNSTFTENTGNSLVGVCYSSINTGDYDNDGDLDILITGEMYGTGSYASKVYRNDGNLIFTEQTNILLPGISNGSAVFGDYNNDGNLDILLAGNGISKVYKNNGDSSFSEQNDIVLTGIYNGSASWGDYDGDGYLDILLTGNASSSGTSNSVTKIYRNDANGNFSEQMDILISKFAGISDWVDYDNDGDLDVVTYYSYWSLENQTSKVYRNNRINNSSINTTQEYCLTKVYPNPANDRLFLKNINFSDATVAIFDLQGNLIGNNKIITNYIDISNLSKGIYFVKIVDSGNIVINKLIKE
jgi:hypothetical protein